MEVISDNLSMQSYLLSKRGLPKSECLTKGYEVQTSEYPTWQRSHRSSPSKGKPCTWQRVAANIFNTINGKCERHYEKS